MGLGDMVNKAKEAFGDEEKSDGLLDKAEDFAKDKLQGHDDKIDAVRDQIDKRVGNE